jgi:hypothetical protein
MVLATISAQRFVLPTKDPVTPLTKQFNFSVKPLSKALWGRRFRLPRIPGVPKISIVSENALIANFGR